ncbi:MAG: CPBP family intramembrane metalloprotease [Verrucomicrobiaceae bacterium]|nr:CPBP family intramembrane metalloprotease [Verrucomicrobiaceae bacterium]
MPINIPISADSIFIYGYFLCVALMATVLPFYLYARDNEPSLRPHQKGLVRTETLNAFDLLGLLIFFGIYAVFLLDYLSPPPLDNQGKPQEISITPWILAVGMVVQLVPPMLVAVMLASRGASMSQFLGLKWKHARYLWVITPAGVIIAYMFMFGIEYYGYSGWLEHYFGNDAMLQETVKTYQETNAVTVRIMIAISAILIAPIAEEIVFRGYIYTAVKRFSGRLFATVLSSLLFGVVHFNISALSGSIWAPISIHALFNASQLLVQEITFH